METYIVKPNMLKDGVWKSKKRDCAVKEIKNLVIVKLKDNKDQKREITIDFDKCKFNNSLRSAYYSFDDAVFENFRVLVTSQPDNNCYFMAGNQVVMIKNYVNITKDFDWELWIHVPDRENIASAYMMVITKFVSYEVTPVMFPPETVNSMFHENNRIVTDNFDHRFGWGADNNSYAERKWSKPNGYKEPSCLDEEAENERRKDLIEQCFGTR